MNEIQQLEFNILNDIVKILEKHNLRYFAIGGTCIGAVRHKGFIPWDDDIDIAMPRSDYEKFRNIYYKELPDYLKKMDGEENSGYDEVFIKIHDNRTTFIENYVKDIPNRYTGVFVDVMPVDGAPNFCNINQKIKFIKKIKFLQRMNTLCRKEVNHPPEHEFVLKKYIRLILKNILCCFFNSSYFLERLNCELNKNSFDNSSLVVFSWRNMNGRVERIIYDSKLFSETIEVPFEDGSIKIPKKYDEYLSLDFGEYMQLPNEDEQRTDHSFYKVDLKQSYTYYAKKREKELRKK